LEIDEHESFSEKSDDDYDSLGNKKENSIELDHAVDSHDSDEDVRQFKNSRKLQKSG